MADQLDDLAIFRGGQVAVPWVSDVFNNLLCRLLGI
jgi:hypothetical protein